MDKRSFSKKLHLGFSQAFHYLTLKNDLCSCWKAGIIRTIFRVTSRLFSGLIPGVRIYLNPEKEKKIWLLRSPKKIPGAPLAGRA